MLMRCKCAECDAIFDYPKEKVQKAEREKLDVKCRDCRRIYQTGSKALNNQAAKMANRYELSDRIQKDLGYRIDHAPVATREAMKRKRIHWK